MSSIIQRCFISVYMLKSSISIGTVATLLIGISLLFVLVYAFIISSVTAQIQSDFRNLFVIVFFLSSIMMVVSSIAAIYGLLRKKNKYLVFYAITIGIYFVSFLLLGIFSTDFPKQLRTQCQKNPQSSSFQSAVNEANNTLCKKQCPCYFPNFFEYTVQQQQTILRMGATFHSDNQSLPYNAENCPKWSNQTHQITPQLLMIQTFFNCAGWCNVDSNYNLYYLFSNLKNGIPKQSCVDAFVQFFDKFGMILQITSFIASAILFIILANIFCLCFHPERTQQYDALKFFRETLVNKTNKKKQVSGTQIFKSKKSSNSIELGQKYLMEN